MATPIDTENLRARFTKIMQSHQLKPQDIKKELSNIAVPDNGEFLCENEKCTHPWRSNFAWITFDIINLEICRRWKMKCMECMEKSTPTFTVPQLESMFEKVILYYKGEDKRGPTNIGYGARRIYRMPHQPNLCEKCCWGSDQCWTRKFTYH